MILFYWIVQLNANRKHFYEENSSKDLFSKILPEKVLEIEFIILIDVFIFVYMVFILYEIYIFIIQFVNSCIFMSSTE